MSKSHRASGKPLLAVCFAAVLCFGQTCGPTEPTGGDEPSPPPTGSTGDGSVSDPPADVNGLTGRWAFIPDDMDLDSQCVTLLDGKAVEYDPGCAGANVSVLAALLEQNVDGVVVFTFLIPGTETLVDAFFDCIGVDTCSGGMSFTLQAETELFLGTYVRVLAG